MKTITEDLNRKLEEAKAEVERLQRQITAAPCSEVGHRWRLLGGASVSCCDDCECNLSVPVHECSVCGDCDYGENEWKEKAFSECEYYLENMKGVL